VRIVTYNIGAQEAESFQGKNKADFAEKLRGDLYALNLARRGWGGMSRLRNQTHKLRGHPSPSLSCLPRESPRAARVPLIGLACP